MARRGIHQPLRNFFVYLWNIFSFFLLYDISRLSCFLTTFPKPTAKLPRLPLDQVSSKMLHGFYASTLLFSFQLLKLGSPLWEVVAKDLGGRLSRSSPGGCHLYSVTYSHLHTSLQPNTRLIFCIALAVQFCRCRRHRQGGREGSRLLVVLGGTSSPAGQWTYPSNIRLSCSQTVALNYAYNTSIIL